MTSRLGLQRWAVGSAAAAVLVAGLATVAAFTAFDSPEPLVISAEVVQMTTTGLLLGAFPVSMGLLTLPMLRRLGPLMVRTLLALTVGLLTFLVIDTAIEGFEVIGETLVLNGPMFLIGAVLTFSLLTATHRLHPHSGDGWRLALMIAIGMGMHNLGEGLAVGSAFALGELTVGTGLVIGFATHNITEGVAMAIPLIRHPTNPVRMLGLAAVAGVPAVAGTLVGVTITSPTVGALMLGLGVGAIAQVAVQILPQLRADDGRRLDGRGLAGIAAGALLMFFAGHAVTG